MVLGYHFRRALNCMAGLLVGPGTFQNMGRQHVADLVWPCDKRRVVIRSIRIVSECPPLGRQKT